MATPPSKPPGPVDPRAPRARVLETFPYPIARLYRHALDAGLRSTVRCAAVDATVYELLRVVGLSLVGQYLREAREDAAVAPTINGAVSALQCPSFSDWILLLRTLARHLPRVVERPLFPELGSIVDALGTVAKRPIPLRGESELAALEAIAALRNRQAHNRPWDVPEREPVATELLGYYVPLLHEILDTFAFLGEVTLVVRDAEWHPRARRARVRSLRGAEPADPEDRELTPDWQEAFDESAAVLAAADGRLLPLDPLIGPLEGGREAVYLYDGHYSMPGPRESPTERRLVVLYKSALDEGQDPEAGARLKPLFEGRGVSIRLSREDTAPWTIRQSAAAVSRGTLDDLVGVKYFPECHVPRPALETEINRFLEVPLASQWPTKCDRRRYRNGLIVAGPAGSGKTAFLAREVTQLLDPGSAESSGPEGSAIVLFMRGDGLTVRDPGEVSLFRDVADRLGIAVDGAQLRNKKPERGFSGLGELFQFLHLRWSKGENPTSRFLLVLDALNEAPYPNAVLRQALDLVGEAARYPWLKVVLSLRQEWLTILGGRLGPQERSPIDSVRDSLYAPVGAEPARGVDVPTRSAHHPEQSADVPALAIDPLTAEEAAKAYGRYQEAATGRSTELYPVPACPTPWEELPDETRELLRAPLHLHIFMDTFDGVPAASVRAAPELFRRHIDRTLRGRPGLERALDAVMAHLLADPGRPTAELSDGDAQAIRQAWSIQLPDGERARTLAPVEALVYEGLVAKRIRAEGGGYRFVFQAVTEYLVYWALAQARPPGEDEFAYWQRRAAPPTVFAEYAGAFQILLRDWIAQGNVDRIAPLLQRTPQWLEAQLVGALVDVARASHTSGSGSPVADAVGAALGRTTGSGLAWALVRAGSTLAPTPFAAAAIPYLRAGCEMARVGHESPGALDVDRAAFLIQGLTWLGNALDEGGATSEAIAAYRRAIDIYSGHPRQEALEIEVARTLVELATVLYRTGGTTGLQAARELCERAVEFCQRRREAEPGDAEVGRQLAWALNTLGNMVDDLGQPDAAVAAYGRAIEILEGLATAGPAGAGPRRTLARVLSDLGTTRLRTGLLAPATEALRRSVEIRESEWAATPEDVGLGQGLLKVQTALGSVLVQQGVVAEGGAMLVRAIETHDRVAKGSPSGEAWSLERARLMLQAAFLLRGLGRLGEAAKARALAAPALEPSAQAALGQGKALSNAGRIDEATAVYLQGLELNHLLWGSNPDDAVAGLRMAALATQLPSDLARVDRDAAAEQYGRKACGITETAWAVHPRSSELGWEVYKAHLFLGVLFRDTNQLKSAIEPFQRAERVAATLVALAPTAPAPLAAQAQVLIELGRLQEAGSLIAAALRLSPEFPWAVMLKENLDARTRSSRGGGVR